MIDRTCALCGEPAHWDRYTLPSNRRGGLALRFCSEEHLAEWAALEPAGDDKQLESVSMGRPKLTLTEKMIEAAERLFRAGHSNKTVGQALGVSRRTVYRWIEDGAKASEVSDTSPHGEMLIMFWHAYIEGRVSVKKVLIENIITASGVDWRAGVWYLSVTEPQDYSEKVVVARALHELGIATQEGEAPPVSPEEIKPKRDAPPPIVKSAE